MTKRRLKSAISRPDPEQLKYWNKLLSDEGLSLHAGDTHHMFCKRQDETGNEDEDVSIFTVHKYKVGANGGRLAGYKLSWRLSHSKVCAVCEWRFKSKREVGHFLSQDVRKTKREARRYHRPVLCVLC